MEGPLICQLDFYGWLELNEFELMTEMSIEMPLHCLRWCVSVFLCGGQAQPHQRDHTHGGACWSGKAFDLQIEMAHYQLAGDGRAQG